MEKSPRLNWATQFFMVTYDGACSPNVFIFQNGMNFLRHLALQEKKKLDDSSRLEAVEIARVPDMLPNLFLSWSG